MVCRAPEKLLQRSRSDFLRRHQHLCNVRLIDPNSFLQNRFINFKTQVFSYMHIDRDANFPYLGLQTIYDRYLLHIDGRRIETPQYFWTRVSILEFRVRTEGC